MNCHLLDCLFHLSYGVHRVTILATITNTKITLLKCYTGRSKGDVPTSSKWLVPVAWKFNLTFGHISIYYHRSFIFPCELLAGLHFHFSSVILLWAIGKSCFIHLLWLWDSACCWKCTVSFRHICHRSPLLFSFELTSITIMSTTFLREPLSAWSRRGFSTSSLTMMSLFLFPALSSDEFLVIYRALISHQDLDRCTALLFIFSFFTHLPALFSTPLPSTTWLTLC